MGDVGALVPRLEVRQARQRRFLGGRFFVPAFFAWCRRHEGLEISAVWKGRWQVPSGQRFQVGDGRHGHFFTRRQHAGEGAVAQQLNIGEFLVEAFFIHADQASGAVGCPQDAAVQHAGNHHVLDIAGPAKEFFLQVKASHGCAHVAMFARRFLGRIHRDFFAGLVVQVKVPVSHDVLGR